MVHSLPIVPVFQICVKVLKDVPTTPGHSSIVDGKRLGMLLSVLPKEIIIILQLVVIDCGSILIQKIGKSC